MEITVAETKTSLDKSVIHTADYLFEQGQTKKNVRQNNFSVQANKKKLPAVCRNHFFFPSLPQNMTRSLIPSFDILCQLDVAEGMPSKRLRLYSK